MPIFSIIIPHKNCPELLKRCIESVPQSDDIEIILVDDNSDDKQLLYDSLGQIGQSNLTVIESDKGGWAGGSRNLGLENAKGEWIIFLDADDYFLPNVFSTFFKYAITENDIIYFKHQSVYSDTLLPCVRFPYRNQTIKNYLLQPTEKNRSLLMFGDVVPWGKMIRRSLIEDNHIRYDLIPCCEDVMFITRCAAEASKIEVSDEIVYCLTYRSSSLTMNYSKEKDWIGFTVALQRNQLLKSLGVKCHKSRIISYVGKAFRRYGGKEATKYIREAQKFKQSVFTNFLLSTDEVKTKFKGLFARDSYKG